MSGTRQGIRRRWDPSFIVYPDDFPEFCSTYLSDQEEQILFIAVTGFDPRACAGCSKLIDESGAENITAILVDIDEGRTSPSSEHKDLIEENKDVFDNILADVDDVRNVTIEMWKGKGLSKRRANPRNAQQILPAESELHSYDKVIFDISAMPKSVMFSVIGKAISIFNQGNDENSDVSDIYTIVTENPSLDKAIEAVGPEDTATYIPGYGTHLEQEATLRDPSIWILILGENKTEHLRRAHNTIEPEEVLPVFPSPSRNPRRADDLLNEYHELLFDEWSVEPTNFVYASESNPFDLYRQILSVAMDYRDALQPIGECKFAVTVTSSKLLSIGAMLGVLDLKWNDFSTGLAQVRYDGYRLPDGDSIITKDYDTNLYCVGLSGTPYE